MIQVGGAVRESDLGEVPLVGVEQPPGVRSFVDVVAGVVEEEEADAEAFLVLDFELLCGG